mmetsp:Transcript_43739/g.103314  ORF Transcript_43739/g.103314 Transcript_43739/m.103314 type:complete len:200 (+) Transcript_43739:51-650(+)
MFHQAPPCSPQSVTTTAGSDGAAKDSSTSSLCHDARDALQEQPEQPQQARKRPVREAAEQARGTLKRLLEEEPQLHQRTRAARSSAESTEAVAKVLQMRCGPDPLGDVEFELLQAGSGMWLECSQCTQRLEVNQEVASVYKHTENVKFMCHFLTGVQCPGRPTKAAKSSSSQAAPEAIQGRGRGRGRGAPTSAAKRQGR